MSDWNVTVVGLGGPSGDFHQRTYQVRTQTPGAALDKAVTAYLEVFEKKGYVFTNGTVILMDQGIQVLG